MSSPVQTDSSLIPDHVQQHSQSGTRCASGSDTHEYSHSQAGSHDHFGRRKPPDRPPPHRFASFTNTDPEANSKQNYHLDDSASVYIDKDVKTENNSETEEEESETYYNFSSSVSPQKTNPQKFKFDNAANKTLPTTNKSVLPPSPVKTAAYAGLPWLTPPCKQDPHDFNSYAHKTKRAQIAGSDNYEQYARLSLSNMSWFWGDITSVEADRKLNNLPDGSFLVRNSRSAESFTLTVKQEGKNSCFRIYEVNNDFGLSPSECRFHTLSKLIMYYNEHSLAEFNRRVTTCLLYPVQKKESTKVSLYDGISILADRGRKLNQVRQQYISLLDTQAKLSICLQTSSLETKAVKTARQMYQALSNPSEQMPDEFDEMDKLTNEQQKKLENSNAQAMKKHKSLMERSAQLENEIRMKEEEQAENLLALNNQMIVLGDQTEDTEHLKEQVLNCGAKREFVDCLLDDSYLCRDWDRILWLVDCSRDEATVMLTDCATGTFLIRSRNDASKPYALSIMCTYEGNKQDCEKQEEKSSKKVEKYATSDKPDKKCDKPDTECDKEVVKHCVIHYIPGQGYGFLREGAVFESVDELVNRHAQTSIKMYFSHIDTCLAYPVYSTESPVNHQ